MSVAQAQREIDSSEFAEWQAYRKLQPFGDSLQTMLFSYVCSWLLNAMGWGRKAGDPLWDWKQCYPRFGEPEEIEEDVIESVQAEPAKKKHVVTKLREFLMMCSSGEKKNGNARNSSNENDLKRDSVHGGSEHGEKRSEGGETVNNI